MMKKLYFAAFILLTFSSGLFGQAPGSFNTNFSVDGWDTIYGNNNGFYVNELLVQPNEQIIICSEGNFSNEGHQAIIIKYNIDGTLDTQFGGGDGMVRSHDDYNLYTRASDMALQNDGKIIVGGDQFYNSERIIRFNQDGTLDSTFGENGVVDFTRPNSEFIYHIGVQSDNKIIVCGQESRLSNGTFQPHVFLWRLTAEGQLDVSFGQAGVVSYIAGEWQNVFESYLRINDLIILPNDAILINQSFTGQTDNFVLIRKLNADGTTDNSFGVGGNAIKSKVFNWGAYTYSNSALQEDGSIVSLITTRNSANETFSESLFRMNAQGAEDLAFNFDFNDTNSFPDVLKIVVLGNKIYVLKKSSLELGFNKIYCFDLSGNLVNTFGTNGVAELSQNNVPNSTNVTTFEINSNGTLYTSNGITDVNSNSNQQFLTSSIVGFPYESSVGLKSLVSKESFVVYPNPSSEKIYIESGTPNLGQYFITDLQGRVVLQTNIDTNSSGVDISNLSNGVYFIKNRATSTQTKFVVLHQ